jgi:ABC-2 type transport system ATP-binding protein
MADITEVIAYIHEAHAVGIADEEIFEQLRTTGWQDADIKRALSFAAGMPTEHTHGQRVATPPEPIILVRNLTKRYGDLVAVDNISFEVYRGETFGILGPNGAGKTTTLEMIEGLKQLSGGTIFLDAKDVARQPHEVKAVIGVQLQASSFFEGLTLKELLEVFASMYDRTVNAMELLEEVQLTEKANVEVKELSGGQKQRFSIAVGLVNQPKVLFLDEPTTGLDPQARRNLWDLVTQIKKRGTTVVLTTHYMDEAEVLCDRIAVMDHAKIVALDTTQNLLKSIGVSSVIQFEADQEVSEEMLSGIVGVESVHAENLTYSLSTTDARRTLDRLFEMSREHHFAIDALTLKRATLEDVFLKLTGHELRD